MLALLITLSQSRKNSGTWADEDHASASSVSLCLRLAADECPLLMALAEYALQPLGAHANEKLMKQRQSRRVSDTFSPRPPPTHKNGCGKDYKCRCWGPSLARILMRSEGGRKTSPKCEENMAGIGFTNLGGIESGSLS